MTKTALVTGAGSGVGREAAVRLAQDGFHVFAAGRTMASLAGTAALAEGAPAGMTAVVADVSRAGDVDALFRRITDTAGRLDVVFNNAGTNIAPRPIDELSLDDFMSVISVNLVGAFLVARAAFGLMRSQAPRGGRIINNGSVSAHAPRPDTVPYTVSKHAITGLTRSLSLDGRAFDIACGQIDIGNAGTDMAAQIGRGVRQADGTTRAEPLMAPVHVAEAVSFMAGLPLGANVQFMTVMATNMPLVGRG